MHASATTPNCLFPQSVEAFLCITLDLQVEFWYCQNVTPPYGGVGERKKLVWLARGAFSAVPILLYQFPVISTLPTFIPCQKKQNLRSESS
jgi:hypothetical protein